MKRGNIFWGAILIILGALFFLQAQGIIADVMGWFWAVFMMLLGVWILTERFIAPGGGDESFALDLQGAAKVAIDLDHGAGSVLIAGGAPLGTAVTGIKGTAMDVKSHLAGETLTVDIDAGPTFIPFLGPEGGSWRFQLTEEVPVSIKLDCGATALDCDFTNVKLDFIGIDTGASSVKLKMPVNAGRTLVDIESGAATIEITVPQGVAGRVRVEQGASSVNIDQSRFALLPGNIYQSSDFDTAANKVEINLEGGANTVNIR